MVSTPGPRPITEVADSLGIAPEHRVPYGNDKAKVRLEARDNGRPRGKLVLVSAITPTSAGEGKTTTSIGLAQGLAQVGESVSLALRQPSLGPIFGMKGGAAGGGRSIVVPAQDINLHFTGDFHAITSAHNLLSAMLDNHLHHGNALGIDPRRVLWPRVLDLNDRALRRVILGLGGKSGGVPRESSFDITAASEVMATLCLAEDSGDLRRRLSRLLVALGHDNQPVTADDLGAVGAMMVLLRDAMMPNLVQSLEGVPTFLHGGPFANIAHGCNSVIATKMALAHTDWVVTEAGFGFDLGAEKFFDIKCASAGLDTACVVLVATVRALKRHGGVKKRDLATPNPEAVERGLANLEKHIESIGTFTEVPVVALNRFGTDSDEEVEVVRAAAERLGVRFAVSDIFEKGGAGGIKLAEAVKDAAAHKSGPYQPLYDWSDPIPMKLERVARAMYGAGEVHLDASARKELRMIQRLGHEGLPVCIAKVPTSLSSDPRKAGRPSGFDITVRRFVLSLGAGFVVALLGDILRMPGLPKTPQAEAMDLVDGEILGMTGG